MNTGETCSNCGGPIRVVGLGVYRINDKTYCDPCGDVITAQPKALSVNLSDQGQMFAGVATIRAALFDTFEANVRELAAHDCEHHPVTDEDADENRYAFVNAVLGRIAELQSPPHDGIKLENLCPRHRRESLPKPTVQVCGMC